MLICFVALLIAIFAPGTTQTAMTQPHKIALLGFSSFERSTFESFFRLAARRAPGYQIVASGAEAALVIVNTDEAALANAFAKTRATQKVIAVGRTDAGTGWPLQQRPIKLMGVLTQVDQMLNPPAPVAAGFASAASPLRPAAGMPARPAASSAVPVASPSVVPMPAPEVSAKMSRSVRDGSGMSHSRLGELAPIMGLNTQPPSDASDIYDDILVVDDSDIALKFMQNRLSRFGFRAQLVRSGEEALGRINVQSFKFVFLDVMMEGLDGYQTCRAIKQRKYAEGKPPVIVMLTSRGGTIDKIRGTLAGCDAYLTKPLNEGELIKVLAKHDSSIERGFKATRVGASGFADSSKSHSKHHP
jgi:two-component system, cell cycle response regulator